MGEQIVLNAEEMIKLTTTYACKYWVMFNYTIRNCRKQNTNYKRLNVTLELTFLLVCTSEVRA